MFNIAVSAHGGRFSNQQPTLEVPERTQVVFYVKDGEILDNQTGYAILAQLEKGTEPGGKVAQQIFAGGKTYDYSCWYAPEFAAACGIFPVGSSTPMVDLSKYTASDPLKLSAILSAYPGRTVYWLCCRTVASSVEEIEALHREGAFPGPAPEAAAVES